jgi:hypothetical protein
MQHSIRACGLACGWAIAAAVASGSAAATLAAGDPEINPPPAAADWAALAKLPDWSGVWTPSFTDQGARMAANPIPWNRAAAAEAAKLVAAEKAGDPKGLFVNCLPESMPSWMLITHNAMEFLFTPGRVTILGESDGNRLRRIYTDGRPHPPDPDPSFHGHSIGHWEGQTLVVDTVGVFPETYIASSEAVGLPNNGDMHIVERIHIVAADTLHDDLEITAPHMLTRTWKVSLLLFRQRARKYDIVEGVCLQGSYSEGKDAGGNAVFVPAPQTEGGNILPTDK